MSNIGKVNVNKFIENLAKELKEKNLVKPAEWAPLVKTGVHKERPPMEEDWWYMRSAAVLRSVYKLGPIGVSKLRTKYGGKQNRGHQPSIFKKGSGNIIRKIMQQLEQSELIKQEEKGMHKGRSITKKGKELLNQVAEKTTEVKA